MKLPGRRRRPRPRASARVHRQGDLRQLLALARTTPDRAIIRDRLWRLYEQAAAWPSPEVHRFAATIGVWWPAVEAAITTGYSNARSEG